MSNIHFVLLYVANPRASARFYQQVLERAPIELSDTFALFALESGLKLGLWGRAGVEPAATGAPGSSEIAFVVPDEAAVKVTHETWRHRGVAILQEPAALDFGFTFTAADPDGHRLRVFMPYPG